LYECVVRMKRKDGIMGVPITTEFWVTKNRSGTP
jgi:hypothetical protein